MTDLTAPDQLQDYVAGVTPEGLAEAILTGVADPGTAQLLEAEKPVVWAWRKQTGRPGTHAPGTGLALSGGGIRSAAFSLGVIQALVARDLFKRMDYVSSVSGGGYTAASLVWWLSPTSGGRFGVGSDNFPYGVEPPGSAGPKAGPEQAALLNFLRQHGSYLTPGHGITLTSAIAAVLRGVILNLLVWVPILVWVMILLLALSLLAGSGEASADGAPAAFDAFLWTALGLGGLYLIGCLAYSFSTYSRQAPQAARYLAHRLFESRAFLLLWPLLASATLASLPYAADASLAGLGQFGGAAFVALGLAIGLWGFFRPESSWVVGFVRKRALPLGALLALYGVLLFAYQSAAWLHHNDDPRAWGAAVLLLALAILSGWFVNLNYISMQRYYRDRLMEAFMPDLERARAQEGGAAAAADGLPLSDVLDPGAPAGPYPLINANLPLAASHNRRRRLRGGDNFLLSPLYCGSAATGWRRTRSFMDDGMTLPTAAAISGTVSHRRSGLGGVGLALNPLVSLLMVLLNLRMGYWVPNPRSETQGRRPNHFHPGLQEALAFGRDEHREFLLLEDGGYFDNLGLYELVRRRLRLIVVSDAGADAGARLADLYRVLRLVETDFGARIAFADAEDYRGVVPLQPADYPEGARLAARGFLVGAITYSDGTRGTLIYLKSTLVPHLGFEHFGYGSTRAGFPQESTVDQFFDEEQFEAHRRLGYALTDEMIDETGLEDRVRRLEEDAPALPKDARSQAVPGPD